MAAAAGINDLPCEIVTHILNYLPPSSYPAARLTSRRFSAVLAKPAFPYLASFLSPLFAVATLAAIAADPARRPKSIWSPHCSIPEDLPVPESFLLAMFVSLRGHSWGLGKVVRLEEDDTNEIGNTTISVDNLNKRLGREDLTEQTLREAMFRYALYLSYTHIGEGTAPQMWVLNRQLWVKHSEGQGQKREK